MEIVSHFELAAIKPAQPIQGWEDFFEDGSGYLKTAVGALARRREVFTAQILYNLAAMAIEKFVMAALMHQGTLPYNHTMLDLVEAMEETLPGTIAEIRDGLLQLDRYQEICDLEGFSIAPPGMEKIPAMLELAGRVKSLVTKKIMTNEP